MKMKVKFLVIFSALACLVAAIVLMILPYGVIMRWSSAPGGPDKITYCAYFDFTPYAYGQFFPLITAIVTAVATVFILLYIFLNKFRLGVFILTLVAVSCSVLAFVFPVNITAISIIVPILLSASAILQIIHRLHKKG